MNERYIKSYTPYLSCEFDARFRRKKRAASDSFPNFGGHRVLPGLNRPAKFLPNMPDLWKYNHMSIIIGTGEWDVTRHESYRLSEVLNSKGIKHWLDDGKWRGHDWNYWQDMLPYYLAIAV